MRVKKYLVNNMPEAMAAIRAQLGPDAVILHSEKVQRGGLFGLFGKSKLEVVAAVDTDLRDFPQPTPAADKAIVTMQHELAALKTTLAQVAKTRQSAAVPRIDSLDQWYRRLVDQGVTIELAQQTIQTVADELNRWALDNHEVLNEHLHWHLGRQLPPSAPLNFEVKPQGKRSTSDQPYVCFIVGPTGVGKTTTIAKLAGYFAHTPRRSARVMIITADTFRVAAIPQISAFGEILNVPVEVAYHPGQLASLIEANRDQDLILIDTPGRSQRDTHEVAELADYLSVVPHKGVHLALSACSKYEDMKHTVEAFGMMPLDRLIFTKIDETLSFGAAYSLTCETGLPLSYLTTGQRVPVDFEVATAERVVDLIVGSVPEELRSTRNRLADMQQSQFRSRQEVSA